MMKKVRRSQGAARFLAASSNFVTAPYNSVFDLEHTDTFTISFWTHTTSAVSTRLINHQDAHNASNKGWYISIDASARFSIIFVDGSGGSASFRGNLSRFITGWTHVVITKSGSGVNTAANYNIWFNGTRQVITTVATSYNTSISCRNNTGLRIGGLTGAFASTYFRDLMIWKGTALSQYQIRRIYNAGDNQSILYSGRLQEVIPQYHIMQYPEIRRVSGGTSTFRDEITGLWNISGTVNTVDTSTSIGRHRSFVSYNNRGKTIRMKNLTNYLKFEFDVYLMYLKNAGGGSSYSTATSVQKCVGNGKVKFRNASVGTSVVHQYLGLHNSGSIPSGPNQPTLRYSAGNGNANRTSYELGTLYTSGTFGTGETVEIEVDFTNTNKVYARWYNPFGTLTATITSTLSASTLFPTGEWYVIPYTFYNNDDTNYRQIYYMAWDFNVSNPGTLQNNDLV